jgi:hypothetical protein
MPEHVSDDEAFEHRLERTLREMGNEAVRPFDPYETTQLVVSNTRIGGVPIPPMAPSPRPEYFDESEPIGSRRWPLLVALLLLVAALGFAGFATGFIRLPSNLGITIGSPAPSAPSSPSSPSSPSVAPSTEVSPTPAPTRRPQRTPRRPRPAPPATQQPQPTVPQTAFPAPTDTPPIVVPTPEPPTTEPTQEVQPTPQVIPSIEAQASFADAGDTEAGDAAAAQD